MRVGHSKCDVAEIFCSRCWDTLWGKNLKLKDPSVSLDLRF